MNAGYFVRPCTDQTETMRCMSRAEPPEVAAVQAAKERAAAAAGLPARFQPVPSDYYDQSLEPARCSVSSRLHASPQVAPGRAWGRQRGGALQELDHGPGKTRDQ